MVGVIELRIIKFASLLDFFGRLSLWPLKRPLWWATWSAHKNFDLLQWFHGQLDRLLLERLGLFGNLWRLFHREDWQRSAKFNARLWVVGFMVFYPMANQIGHAWKVSVGVALGLDLMVYLFHKDRLWPERRNGYRRSYALWLGFWGVTFLLNTAAAWYLLDQIRLGNATSKILMAAVGIFINPWVFRFRDKVALKDRVPGVPNQKLPEEVRAEIEQARVPRLL